MIKNKKDEVNLLNLFSADGSNSTKIPISLSYSRLSDFDRNGPVALVKRGHIDGIGVKIGSIVDDLLLPVEGFNFDDHYIVSDCKRPTSNSLKLANIVLENYTEVPSIDELFKICRKNSLWSGSLDDTLKDKLANNKDLLTYLKDNINPNKEVITTEDKILAEQLVEVLRLHKHSAPIFNNDYQKIYQYSLEYKYKGVVLRGKTDIILIDHNKKIVYIIDLKTGAKPYSEFVRSFIDFRYYLQSAVYQSGFEKIKKDLQLPDEYKLAPFRFLYIGRSERLPMILEVDETWAKAAVKGFTRNGYEYRGLDELIDEVCWHFYNNEFKLTREAYESNGIIKLKSNTISVNEE